MTSKKKNGAWLHLNTQITTPICMCRESVPKKATFTQSPTSVLDWFTLTVSLHRINTLLSVAKGENKRILCFLLFKDRGIHSSQELTPYFNSPASIAPIFFTVHLCSHSSPFLKPSRIRALCSKP